MTKKELESPQVIYKVYGLNLVSQYHFTHYHKSFPASPDQASSPVYFACHQIPPFPVNWKKGKLIYSQEYLTPTGTRWNKLYHFDAYDIFQFGWGADYYLSKNRIDCHLYNPAFQPSVEWYLMGIILAFWLEREGFPVLHSSAIVVNEQVVAFPSHSGNGKSTLAASFLQAGAALLTDDILAIENQAGQFWGRPGLPQINLWPDQAAYFTGEKEFEIIPLDGTKQPIHIETFNPPGTFCQKGRPLKCIYIPRKSDQPAGRTDIEITQVPPAEAVIELLRYSFISSFICEQLGWQSRRLDFFARLVRQVPVRRLVYPAGFEHLAGVTEAVMRDLENLPGQT